MGARPPASPLNPTFALALVASLGCLLLAVANLNQERIVEWIVSEPEKTPFRLRLLLSTLGCVGVLPVAFIAVYAARLSNGISASGRYPPPEFLPRRSTRIREGPRAAAIARRLRIAAILLAAITLTTPALFWWLGASLTPG